VGASLAPHGLRAHDHDARARGHAVERLAYTRTEAAHALGISRSTFNRRVLPYIDTIEMPWGTKLIPFDELARLLPSGDGPGGRGRIRARLAGVLQSPPKW
jgi:hypothetical protein